MSQENKQQRSRWERWKDPYRLVILNDETFQEVNSYKLTVLNVYILLSMLIVLVAGFVMLAIAFTPIKRLIPGYSSASNQMEMIQLYRDLDSLETMLRDQERYNEALNRLLGNQVQYAPTDPPPKKAIEDHPLVERSEEDAKLRNEVEMNQIRQATGETPVTNPVNISPRETPLEQLYFTPPLSGSVVSIFNPDKNHIGVDVVAPKNTPVKTVMDGWVISSDWTLETGNTIAIQHTNNIVTFYKHNSALLKKAGSYVRAGEAIAIIGNTGELTDGPHLHFELWHRGKPVNPTDFVNFR